MKKAPAGAFFVCAVWGLGSPAVVAAATEPACRPDSERTLPSMRVVSVYDGDTLTLADGQRVRLIGINTPERGEPDEPLALAARDALATRVLQREIQVQPGTQARDRYGRQLGHVFVEGANVTAELLAAGLGYHITLPPNLGYLPCYRRAQQRAQQAERGVWQAGVLPPREATPGKLKPGYQRVRGPVSAVWRHGNSIRVRIQDGLELRLEYKDAVYLAGTVFDRLMAWAWVDHPAPLWLEVSGWLVDRSEWATGPSRLENGQSDQRTPYQLRVRHREQWRIVAAASR